MVDVRIKAGRVVALGEGLGAGVEVGRQGRGEELLEHGFHPKGVRNNRQSYPSSYL